MPDPAPGLPGPAAADSGPVTVESLNPGPDCRTPGPESRDPNPASSDVPLLVSSRHEWADRFDIAANLPNIAFAEAVWDALIHYGRALPEDQRPGPPRPWQGAALLLLLQFAHASLQGARQGAGKTFVAALVIACHLLLGGSVTVAMPTYRQGSCILVRRVLLFMGLLEGPLGLKRLRCNIHESAWDNGAQLLTLSSSPGGRRGTQGWTSRVVVIDESHDLQWTELAWFMPIVAMAMKQRRGRLLLLGVGAEETAAPMLARQSPEYASLVLDDATLSELDRMRRGWLPPDHPELAEDSWAEFFAAERELWDEDYYRQFYMCQSPGSGRRKVFDRVPEMVSPVGATPCVARGLGQAMPDPLAAAGEAWLRQYSGLGMAQPLQSQIFLGVDVGKQRDQTVVAVLQQLGNIYNLVDCVRLPLGMPYTEQARELAALARQWGCPPGRFCVEVNGPGQALYDLLADPLAPAIWCATPLHMSVQRKAHIVGRLAADARRGIFGVAEIPLQGSKVSESGLNPMAGGTGVIARGRVDFNSHAACNEIQLSSNDLRQFDGSIRQQVTGGDARATKPSISCFGPTIRSHLANLHVDFSDDGVTTYEHSDILSALIIARCAIDDTLSI